MVISREDLFLKSHLHRIPASSSCFLPPSVFGSFKSSTRSKTVYSKFQLLSYLPLNSSVVNSTNSSDKISNGKLRDTYDATMPTDDEFTKEHSVARASEIQVHFDNYKMDAVIRSLKTDVSAMLPSSGYRTKKPVKKFVKLAHVPDYIYRACRTWLRVPAHE